MSSISKQIKCCWDKIRYHPRNYNLRWLTVRKIWLRFQSGDFTIWNISSKLWLYWISWVRELQVIFETLFIMTGSNRVALKGPKWSIGAKLIGVVPKWLHGKFFVGAFFSRKILRRIIIRRNQSPSIAILVM
jgi:hypothetical protein